MASHTGIGGRNDAISAPPAVHPATPKLDRSQVPVVPSATRIPGGLVMTSIVDGLQRPVSTVSVSLGFISLLYLRSWRRNTL